MHPTRSAVVVAVAIAAVLIGVGATADEGERLAGVVFMHRHGARTPLPGDGVNQTAICGAYPCGMLTYEGKLMLQALGTKLKKRYGDLLPDYYNPDRVVQRSTDVHRTLQSADGTAKGLYDTNTQYYPAISTKPLKADWIGLPPEALSWKARFELHETPVLTLLGQYAKSIGLNNTTMAKAAALLHLTPVCGSNDDAAVGHCTLVAQDTIASYNTSLSWQANYTQDEWQTLMEIKPRLDFARIFRNKQWYRYQPSTNALDKSIGANGQEIPLRWLEDMAADLVPGAPFTLHEYSAHDSSVMPLWAALGVTENAYLPLFAVTVLMEVGTWANGTAFVRAYEGNTQQGPPPYSFSFQPLNQLKCMDAANNVYANYQCPLADWKRYVTTANKGTSPAGLCYVEPAVMATLHQCDDSFNGTTMENFFCGRMREFCPAEVCGDGCFISPRTQMCFCPSSKPAPEHKEKVAIAVAAILGLLGGVLLCAGFLKATQRKDTDYSAMA